VVSVCALTVTRPMVIMAATIASKFRFPKCIFPSPFCERKADAAPGELQLNSEILFFAKAPGAGRRAHRCRWSRIGALAFRIFVMTKVLAPANITGNFDSTTEQAVKDFQQGAGLTVDGIVGPMTWQALSRRSKYAAIISWCVRQRCDRVTKRSQKIFNSSD